MSAETIALTSSIMAARFGTWLYSEVGFTPSVAATRRILAPSAPTRSTRARAVLAINSRLSRGWDGRAMADLLGDLIPTLPIMANMTGQRVEFNAAKPICRAKNCGLDPISTPMRPRIASERIVMSPVFAKDNVTRRHHSGYQLHRGPDRPSSSRRQERSAIGNPKGYGRAACGSLHCP